MAAGCAQYRLLLQAELDGELDAAAAAALAEHVERCPDCQALREALIGLERELKEALPRDPAPAALRQRIET
ncbi:MAG TPA: zf-HC2 domain-containing protein, partial [Crenalkalicoccus sp.]|nr:zf-HC2 domain-containing protein [Crenalkalicoccus sp.]